MPSRIVILLLAVLLALASCGGSDVKPATGDTDAKKVAGPSNEEVQAYFEDLDSVDPDRIDKAIQASAPESLAQAYAKFFLAQANASIDGGYPFEAGSLSEIDGGFRTCHADENGEKSCTTWTDVESEGAKIANFKVGGKSLADRISVGDGSTKKAGGLAEVEFLVAYHLVTDNGIQIALQVESKDDKIYVGTGEARYRGPDGRQTNTGAITGPNEIEADSVATVTMFFDRAKPGGRLTLDISDSDFAATKTVKFETR